MVGVRHGQLVCAVGNQFSGYSMTDRRVALLFGDRIAQARLSEAFRGFASLLMIEETADLEDMLRADGSVCATVIFFSPSRQSESLRAAERLRAACPDHPVIGYVDPRTINSRFILETGKADLADLVLRDIDDSRAVLLRVLQNAEQRSIATRVVEEMCDGLPRHARIALQFIGRRLREPLDVPGIAAALGVSRRTLHHRLEQAGSPSVRELVGWCRVVFVTHQLCTANASLATIASQLDEPSWRNLNYLLRRYLGKGAQQLRHPEAFAQTIATFHAAFKRDPVVSVPAVVSAPANTPVNAPGVSPAARAHH